MRIISKPNEQEYQMTCPDCGAVFAFTKKDIYGSNHVVCPCCEHLVEPDYNNPIVADDNNPYKFPEAFYHFGDGDTKKLSDEETQALIDEVVQHDIPVGYYSLAATGDTIVFAVNLEDDGLSIYVAKNYWEYNN